jgi:hypothetical protein
MRSLAKARPNVVSQTYLLLPRAKRGNLFLNFLFRLHFQVAIRTVLVPSRTVWFPKAASALRYRSERLLQPLRLYFQSPPSQSLQGLPSAPSLISSHSLTFTSKSLELPTRSPLFVLSHSASPLRDYLPYTNHSPNLGHTGYPKFPIPPRAIFQGREHFGVNDNSRLHITYHLPSKPLRGISTITGGLSLDSSPRSIPWTVLPTRHRRTCHF